MVFGVTRRIKDAQHVAIEPKRFTTGVGLDPFWRDRTHITPQGRRLITVQLAGMEHNLRPISNAVNGRVDTTAPQTVNEVLAEIR